MRRALAFALVAVVLGGSMGWLIQVPVFRSEGILLVEPGLQDPSDPGCRPLAMFQAFMAYQVELLGARRTTLLALKTEPWTSTGEGSGLATAERFEARRTIVHERDTQLLLLRFEDLRPEVALAGVRALLDAYETLRAETESQTARPLAYAREELESATARLATIGQEILTLTQEFGGVEALEIRHRAVLEQLLEAKREGESERVRELRELDGRLGGIREQVARLEAEREREIKKLEQIKKLVEELEHKVRGSGRVEVRGRGVLPTEPFRRAPSWTPAVGAASAALLALLLARLTRRRD